MDRPDRLHCYTIGHAKYPLDVFLYFLGCFGINCVVDVRSVPYSRSNPQYNRENLQDALHGHHIEYKSRGDRLGGRYTSPNLLFPDGTVNYKKVSELPAFQEGIVELISLLQRGKRIALMCSEKEPARCHRFALVARHLQKRGVVVEHIRPGITTQSHQDLEQELMHAYLAAGQTTITDSSPDALDALYERINRKIAYKAAQSGASQQDAYYDRRFRTALEIRNSMMGGPAEGVEPDDASRIGGNTGSRGRHKGQQILF